MTDTTKRNVLIGVGILVVILLVGFFVLSSPENGTDTTGNNATSTSTSTPADVDSRPVKESAPTPSGVSNKDLDLYWENFIQGGKCAHTGVPKGTTVYSFSGEGAPVPYDGESEVVRCGVDDNLYVK